METETVSASHTMMSTPNKRQSTKDFPIELKNAIEKMSIQEKKLNIKFGRILKKKKLTVFDSYDGSYRDPKIGDLHS